MVSKRPISWFLSETGRNFSYGVMSATGLALTTLKYAPHTFFLDKYKEFVHNYNNGKPVDLSDEISKRFQECINILEISDFEKKLIKPFSAFGYDLFHAGSTKTKFGAAIGIPINFYYKSEADIENDQIQVNLKKIDWSSENGQKLKNALLLTENEQKFAICREILMSRNYKIMFEPFYPFLSVMITYNVSQIVNRKLNLYRAPVIIRATLYSIVVTFALGIYFLLKDMTEVHYETKVDEELCTLGPEYIESGVTFYDKLLKRNQALRVLMGREGERKYSKIGNEDYTLRHPHIDLVHRKQYFQEKLKELKKDEDKSK